LLIKTKILYFTFSNLSLTGIAGEEFLFRRKLNYLFVDYFKIGSATNLIVTCNLFMYG